MPTNTTSSDCSTTSSFPITSARVAALFVESTSYGVYLVTLWCCAMVLWDKCRKEGRWHLPLVIATALLAIIITLDIGAAIQQPIDALNHKGGKDPVEVLCNISGWTSIVRVLCQQGISLIADGMLIYRCLVVYAYKWQYIVASTILWLGNIACSVVILYKAGTSHKQASVTANMFKGFVVPFLVLSTAITTLTTGLITHKIWKVSTGLGGAYGPYATTTKSRVSNANRIIIDSGMMTTVVTIIVLITYLTGHNSVYITSDFLNVITGISFNLIILRVYRATRRSQASLLPRSIPVCIAHNTPTSEVVMIGNGVHISTEAVRHSCGSDIATLKLASSPRDSLVV